jgi:hypothetical protein
LKPSWIILLAVCAAGCGDATSTNEETGTSKSAIEVQGNELVMSASCYECVLRCQEEGYECFEDSQCREAAQCYGQCGSDLKCIRHCANAFVSDKWERLSACTSGCATECGGQQ